MIYVWLLLYDVLLSSHSLTHSLSDTHIFSLMPRRHDIHISLVTYPFRDDCTEAIVQLSFYFSDNLVDLRQKFITTESGVEQLFNELLDLPSSRQLDVEVGLSVVSFVLLSILCCVVCTPSDT